MKVCQKARDKSFYGLSRNFRASATQRPSRSVGPQEMRLIFCAKFHEPHLPGHTVAPRYTAAAMTLAAVCPPATTTLSCSHPGCNYTTDRVNNLTRHERTHSGHSENAPHIG